jgi:uncharacterized membrane protein YkoI
MRALTFIALALTAFGSAAMDARAMMPAQQNVEVTAPLLAIQQGLLPLDRVLSTVTHAVPGRVLDVQVVGNAYRVKVLTAKGRVAYVLVDGRSGQVLRVD